MLQVIDGRWKDHLLDMDYLQEGIHLRALGQRDPLVEYKAEGFDLFQDMLEGVKLSTVTTLMKNSPEDLALFTAITLEEPVMALNYTSGDDLAYQTSFAGAAQAVGEVEPTRRPTTATGGRAAARRPSRPTAAAWPCSSAWSTRSRPQRPLPVRLGQEVQEVPRRVRRRGEALLGPRAVSQGELRAFDAIAPSWRTMPAKGQHDPEGRKEAHREPAVESTRRAWLPSAAATASARESDVPWRQMVGMRNVVVHDYADVDLALVWKTVREDLPGLIRRLNAILAESGTS